MDEFLITLLKVLNTMTPLGLAALLGLVLFYTIRTSRSADAQHDTLTTIKGNDLHELPQMAQDLRTAVETLQRMEVKIGEEFSYIRARLNGSGK